MDGMAMDDRTPCRGQHVPKVKSRRYEVIPVHPETPHASRLLVGDKKYERRYVALRSFNDRTVVASGLERGDVRQQAQRAGCPSPLIQYIPKGETLDL